MRGQMKLCSAENFYLLQSVTMKDGKNQAVQMRAIDIYSKTNRYFGQINQIPAHQCNTVGSVNASQLSPPITT